MQVELDEELCVITLTLAAASVLFLILAVEITSNGGSSATHIGMFILTALCVVLGLTATVVGFAA